MKPIFTKILIILAVSYSMTTGVQSQNPCPQWIVVSAPEFWEETLPLCEYRKSEGLNVIRVRTTDVLSAEELKEGKSEALRKHLRKLCSQTTGTSYILLVGAMKSTDAEKAGATVVPPLAGLIQDMKGKPTDHGYGLPGEDFRPCVAVGRFPARTREEARFMVDKSLRFERDRAPGKWRHRLTIVVGNPGGNSPLEKRFAEFFIRIVGSKLFQDINPLWNVITLFHAPFSPFYVPDRNLRETALEYFRDGSLFVIFLGHSGANGLYSNGKSFLTVADFQNLRISQGSYVFFTCGCYSCQIEGPDGEGYGLMAARNPYGPVAVIGAHGISYAALGQLAFQGLLDGLNSPSSGKRLADFWMDVTKGLANKSMDPLTFYLYDQADGSMGKAPLSVQRKQHLEMWTLLGDPALNMPFIPQDIQLRVTDPITTGTKVTIKGILPERLSNARVEITLERPTGSLPFLQDPRVRESGETGRNAAQERLAQANDYIIQSCEIFPTGNLFEISLKTPDIIPWPRLILRAWAFTEKEEGMKVLELKAASIK